MDGGIVQAYTHEARQLSIAIWEGKQVVDEIPFFIRRVRKHLAIWKGGEIVGDDLYKYFRGQMHFVLETTTLGVEPFPGYFNAHRAVFNHPDWQ